MFTLQLDHNLSIDPQKSVPPFLYLNNSTFGIYDISRSIKPIDRPEIFCLYKQTRASIVADLRIQNKQQQVDQQQKLE